MNDITIERMVIFIVLCILIACLATLGVLWTLKIFLIILLIILFTVLLNYMIRRVRIGNRVNCYLVDENRSAYGKVINKLENDQYEILLESGEIKSLERHSFVTKLECFFDFVDF